MVIDDELREMIISQDSTVALRKKAQEKGMRTLGEDGITKAINGLTSIEGDIPGVRRPGGLEGRHCSQGRAFC